MHTPEVPHAAYAPPYPPPPWRLRGTLFVSAFVLPARRLPAALLAAGPPGRPPLRLGGRVLLGVACARYQPPGVLAYDELLVALAAGLARGAPCVTIPQIWVDSPASRDGARAIWAIPKELAAFEWDDVPNDVPNGSPRAAGRVRVRARVGGAGAAALDAAVGPALAPGRVPLALATAQQLGGAAVLARHRATARVRRLRAAWAFDAGGPLDYLRGARPWASLACCDAALAFGIDAEPVGGRQGVAVALSTVGSSVPTRT